MVENERPFPPETEFVRLAVGPSSGGVFKGTLTVRNSGTPVYTYRP